MATRLARRAVAIVAPHELPQFELTAQAFHSAPEHRRAGHGAHRDDPLGFGLETAATLLGTVSLVAAVHVLDHFSQQAAGQVADTARQGLRGRFRRRRRALEAAPALPRRDPLSAEQLAELRQVARATALRLRVPEAEAQAIADGIVAELATAAREPTVGEGTGEAPAGTADGPE
ncbi:hypothetical protein ACFWGM_12670 [Streptomyces roseolus]|uniref:hypothetical protein n=1 Tax=Streptomyces roseolus TaxID=67358 RepID=UPI0036315B98